MGTTAEMIRHLRDENSRLRAQLRAAEEELAIVNEPAHSLFKAFIDHPPTQHLGSAVLDAGLDAMARLASAVRRHAPIGSREPPPAKVRRLLVRVLKPKP